MKLIKAIKKGNKIRARVELDTPEFVNQDLETGKIISQSKNKVIAEIEFEDLQDEDLNLEKIMLKAEELNEKDTVIFENLEIDKVRITEKAKAKKGIREW